MCLCLSHICSMATVQQPCIPPNGMIIAETVIKWLWPFSGQSGHFVATRSPPYGEAIHLQAIGRHASMEF